MHSQFNIENDGIAILTLNHQSHPVNVLDEDLINETLEHFNHVVSNPGIKGLIIHSGKSSFIAGVDLSLLGSIDLEHPEKFKSLLLKVHTGMVALEECPKPVVCIINGTTLGGGLELALCANRIIGVEGATGSIGFPEIKLGMFPGMGGSVRTPRLIGLQNALELIFKGKMLNLQQAYEIGLVHEISNDPMTSAKKWILNNPSVSHPCLDEAKRRTLSPYHPKSNMIFAAASHLIRQDTWKNYPNAQAALQTIYETTQLDLRPALNIEANYFSKILHLPSTQEIIKTLFIDKKRLDQLAHSPMNLDKHFIKIGVVGAGFMGSEIAYSALSSGLKVALIDNQPAQLERAKTMISDLNEKALKHGKTNTKTTDFLNSLTLSDNYDALSDCELVIEAVFENRSVKKAVLGQIALHVSHHCIIASNTSTLPITSLAEYVNNPQRFIGIHFFSPVHKMQLVEMIWGEKTNDHTMASALLLAKLLRKTPICVGDGRGFYTTRVVISYLSEGMRMLDEGFSPALIEHAGKAIGMPVGPLSLADEIALDLALNIREQTIQDEGSNWHDDGIGSVLNWMVTTHKRLGRKSQGGFYDYPAQGAKKLWPELSHFKKPIQQDFNEIKERLLFRQLVEVQHIINAGILTDPAQINVGAILGFGFCPWSGGPHALIKSLGKNFIEKTNQLATKHGDRFKVIK
jgi:3-hydroxyacyl-CoA dehydrogenase/enoyl-CoA hydratase/3-hydroxybutyryl-CoA epimerase